MKKIIAILSLFNDDCYWRDFLCFTWNIKTLEGKIAIQNMLQECLSNTMAYNWYLKEEIITNNESIEGIIEFETNISVATGYIKIINNCSKF